MPPGRRGGLAPYVALSVAIPLALLLGGDNRWLAGLLAAQLCAWGIVLVRPRGEPTVARGRLPGARALRRAAWGMVAFSFVSLAVCHWLIDGSLTSVVDETIYLLQARLFGQPGFARVIDPTMAPFLTIRQAMISNGRMIGQYTPGWPAILWLFGELHLLWWTGAIVGGAGVYMTYRLGARLRSPMAGVVAAGLLALNGWFVVVASGYLPHSGDILFAVTAALLIVNAERITRPREWSAAIGAGAVLGILCLSRPVTGAAIGASLWLWAMVRRPRSDVGAQFILRLTGALAIGLVPFAAAALAYNAATTGSAFTMGYLAINGAAHSFGFGARGVADYGPAGKFIDALPFTPAIAVENLIARVVDLAMLGVGGALLIPLLGLGHAFGFRVRWRELACFVVLPVVHFFYFWSAIRYYLVLLPFLYIELGAVFEHVYRRSPSRALRVAVAAVTAGVAIMVVSVRHLYETVRPVRSANEQVVTASATQPKMLVFVQTVAEDDSVYQALYRYNIDRFPGAIVVARDLGDLDLELIRRLPGYAPYRIRQHSQ